MTRQPITSRLTGILGTYYLASAADREDGRRWYAAAHDEALRLSGLLPYSVITTAGVIAALSPNNQWARNLQDAAAVLNEHHAQGPHAASRVSVCTYDANKLKALAILSMQGPTVDTVAAVLNGRKVSAFFRCILGSSQAVCVDGHAYSVWAGEHIPTTKTPKIGPRLYERIAADYRLAAMAISGREPRVTPAELQAITWVTHRRLRQLRNL
jgi:hypothetical protein